MLNKMFRLRLLQLCCRNSKWNPFCYWWCRCFSCCDFLMSIAWFNRIADEMQLLCVSLYLCVCTFFPYLDNTLKRSITRIECTMRCFVSTHFNAIGSLALKWFVVFSIVVEMHVFTLCTAVHEYTKHWQDSIQPKCYCYCPYSRVKIESNCKIGGMKYGWKWLKGKIGMMSGSTGCKYILYVDYACGSNPYYSSDCQQVSIHLDFKWQGIANLMQTL